MAQYISMAPKRVMSDRARERSHFRTENRIRAWREHSGPPVRGGAFPGDSRNWEIEHGETAKLTPLGEMLLGLPDLEEASSQA